MQLPFALTVAAEKNNVGAGPAHPAADRRPHPLGGGPRLPRGRRDHPRQEAARPGRDQPGGVRAAQAAGPRLARGPAHRSRLAPHPPDHGPEGRRMTVERDTLARRSLRRFTLGSGPLKRRSDRVQVAGRIVVVLSFLLAPLLAVVVSTAT